MSTYPRRGLQRILAGSATPVLRVTLRSQDGEPIAPAGTVTVQVTRSDGTSVLAAGTATTNTGTGTYTATISTANAATLDVLTAIWSDGTAVRATTYHRVVGGFLVSRSDLRGQDGLYSQAEFTDDVLDAARFAVEDLIDDRSGVSWVPRYDMDTTIGTGSTKMRLTWPLIRSLRSLTVDGVAQDLDYYNIFQEAGYLTGSFPYGTTIVAGYEHGYDAPPADMKRAALGATRYQLLGDSSRLSMRARQHQGADGSTIALGYAGAGHPTGLDEVDAVIVAYGHRAPSIG